MALTNPGHHRPQFYWLSQKGRRQSLVVNFPPRRKLKMPETNPYFNRWESGRGRAHTHTHSSPFPAQQLGKGFLDRWSKSLSQTRSLFLNQRTNGILKYPNKLPKSHFLQSQYENIPHTSLLWILGEKKKSGYFQAQRTRAWFLSLFLLLMKSKHQRDIMQVQGCKLRLWTQVHLH